MPHAGGALLVTLLGEGWVEVGNGRRVVGVTVRGAADVEGADVVPGVVGVVGREVLGAPVVVTALGRVAPDPASLLTVAHAEPRSTSVMTTAPGARLRSRLHAAADQLLTPSASARR